MNKIGNLEFIWGIKSMDDESLAESANFNTLNDLDIIYDTEKKKYFISIETIYEFDDKENGLKIYMNKLYNQFTLWSKENSIDTNYKIDLYDIMHDGVDFDSGFDSIPQLYGYFKIIVRGLYND